jgi:hypothetical protein
MENKMKARFLIAATTLLVLTAAPATPAWNARESEGMSNFYKQDGGPPHGGRFNMMIFRNEHNRMRSHHNERCAFSSC